MSRQLTEQMDRHTSTMPLTLRPEVRPCFAAVTKALEECKAAISHMVEAAEDSMIGDVALLSALMDLESFTRHCRSETKRLYNMDEKTYLSLLSTVYRTEKEA